MKTDRVEAEKLLSEYTALAPDYDRRWSGYLRASLSMTMKFVRELPAGKTLDVACGTGQLLAMLAAYREDVQLFGIDRVPAMLEVANQRLGKRATFLDASAEVLPFEASAFDLITCTNALHYFADADAALREMRRVIAPSGNLVIGDWCRDYMTMKLLNRVLPRTRHAHVHTFSLGEMEQSLARAGFRIVSSSKKKIDWFWGLLSIHAVPD